MKASVKSPLDVLRGTPVFAQMPEAALAHLAGLARNERFARRTLVAAAGTRPDVLRYLRGGAMEIALVSANGNTASSLPIAGGAWVTWLGCFHHTPLPHDIWATAACDSIAFPCHAVRALVEAHPRAYHHLIQEIGGHLREFISWTLESAALDQTQKLARIILDCCPLQDGASARAAQIDLTQEQLGRLGMGSRQRAGRYLRVLEEKALIVRRYGKIQISDMQGLKEFLNA